MIMIYILIINYRVIIRLEKNKTQKIKRKIKTIWISIYSRKEKKAKYYSKLLRKWKSYTES